MLLAAASVRTACDPDVQNGINCVVMAHTSYAEKLKQEVSISPLFILKGTQGLILDAQPEITGKRLCRLPAANGRARKMFAEKARYTGLLRRCGNGDGGSV